MDKHILYRLKAAKALKQGWQEMAAFNPPVPGIDGDQSGQNQRPGN